MRRITTRTSLTWARAVLCAGAAAVLMALPPALPGRAAPARLLDVAAASDLRFALAEIAGRFEQARGIRVVPTFGSSGQLAAQIQQGAPFDLFFSANEAFVRRLAASGAIDPATVTEYAIGRLVVWVRRDSAIDPGPGLRALLDPRVRFVAVANPQHAPYGTAAVQAMQRGGIYDRLRGKLVLGETISQTLQFVQSGNADAAITALALALAPTVAATGRFGLVPAASHDPIRQAAGVTARARDPQLARDFLAAVTSAEGQAVLRRYGFLIPAPPR